MDSDLVDDHAERLDPLQEEGDYSPTAGVPKRSNDRRRASVISWQTGGNSQPHGAIG
jgi:hypothetical protein|eukprot:COSAG02_NODE_1338_length_13189_cov_28.102292_6_plen_57_part_00